MLRVLLDDFFVGVQVLASAVMPSCGSVMAVACVNLLSADVDAPHPWPDRVKLPLQLKNAFIGFCEFSCLYEYILRIFV